MTSAEPPRSWRPSLRGRGGVIGALGGLMLATIAAALLWKMRTARPMGVAGAGVGALLGILLCVAVPLQAVALAGLWIREPSGCWWGAWLVLSVAGLGLGGLAVAFLLAL